MAPKRKASKDAPKRTTKKFQDPFPQTKFDIPYFQHMSLNPARYPPGIATPIAIPDGIRNRKSDRNAGDYDQDNATVSDWEERVADFDELFFTEDYNPLLPPTHVVEARARASPTPKLKREAEGPAPSAPDKKKIKIGGRSQVAKAVNYELDSDDELIVQMKQARYLEKDIAARLVAENRKVYAVKSIGTRWIRIKQVLQDRQDDLLDAELTDWHDDDDHVLMEAVAKAERDVEKAKAAAEAKKWKMVAENLKAIKPVTNFSKDACQARFHALEEGFAKPTPESIANPDEKTLAAIARRRRKEEELRIIEEQGVDAFRENLARNGWMRKNE